MKWIKTKFGEIGVVENKNKIRINLKTAQEMCPKGTRIMKSWEMLRLIDEDFDSIKDVKRGYYFTHSNELYYRVSGLVRADLGSWFIAFEWNVDLADRGLLGVLAVKVDNG